MKAKHGALWVTISILVGLIALGTVGFKILEDWTWIQAFYFAVATASTVGYGDLTPTHDLTRLFAALYIILSVVCFFVAVGLYTDRVLKRTTKRK